MNKRLDQLKVEQQQLSTKVIEIESDQKKVADETTRFKNEIIYLNQEINENEYEYTEIKRK